MHHIDPYRTLREKALLSLEQILEATPKKTAIYHLFQKLFNWEEKYMQGRVEKAKINA